MNATEAAATEQTRPLHVLWVSIAFPPKNDPEALQNARYLEALHRGGDVRIDAVTTANPTLWMPVDPKLERYLVHVDRLVEVRLRESRLASIALSKLVPSLVRLPDAKQMFHWGWRSVVPRVRKPDVVYSRSFPMSSAFLARKLARHFGVPWVMHLSDPWLDSYFTRPPRLTRALTEHWERTFLDEAAAVTVASRRLAEAYARRYPSVAHKIRTLPNVTDDATVVPERAARPGPLRIAYTGSIQSVRSLKPFLAVLERLRAARPDLVASIEVDIAGSADPSERRAIEACSFPVKFHGVVPFDRAVALQREADVLLSVDSPVPDDQAVYLPSKLLDYLASGVPVLALTNPRSMTADFVRGGIGWAFAHDDGASAVALLESLSRKKQAGEPLLDARGGREHLLAEYSAAHNGARLRALLRQVRS